jgi:DNA polymerase V
MQNDPQIMAGSDGVSVHSGFPNPALDRRDQQREQRPRLALDLNQLLVRHPSSTYLFRVSGHHWSDQGIFDGDVAVIDRARQARASDLIVAWRGGDSTLCRQRQLTPADKPWGVVTAIIHQYQ